MNVCFLFFCLFNKYTQQQTSKRRVFVRKKKMKSKNKNKNEEVQEKDRDS